MQPGAPREPARDVHSASGGAPVRFGQFEFDSTTLELRNAGHLCRLPPQPAKVLRLLISRAGELVSRDDLRVEIWGTDTFVDFEQGLNFCVKRIRAVLHDDPERPIYVETIPRRGYRFIAPLEPAPAARTSEPAGSSSARRSHRRWVALALAGVALASLSAYVASKRATAGAGAIGGGSTVAVLPFENVSGDPEQDYFSQGFTEETVALLAQVNPSALAVIGRTTVQRHAASGKTPRDIGRGLGASHILEGRVRREGDRVRVTAQVTAVDDGDTVWAGSYERDIRDVLRLQQQVAVAIAGAIGSALPSAPFRAVNEVDPEAYQLYLKGRFFWNQRRPEGMAKARQYFEAALARDSRFARAYAGLGDVEFLAGGPGALPALGMARKALALDPTLGEAHVTAAHAAMHTFDWAEAGAGFQRAIQLDPGYAPARYLHAEYLVASGRFDEAVAEARRAVELDPAGSIANHALGTIYYYSRRYEDAAPQFTIALELDPEHRWSHSRLGQVHEAQARYDDALREFAAGGFTHPQARVKARAGEPGDARQFVATASPLTVSPYDLALVLTALGQVNAALDALDRATKLPSYDAVYLAVDPKLDALRSSPRFGVLLERVGLSHVRAARVVTGSDSIR